MEVMMREKLASITGQEDWFAARIGDVRNDNGMGSGMVCLRGIRRARNGKCLTDHAWVSYCKPLKETTKGDYIVFKARVTPYQSRKKLDYSFAHIRNVRIIPQQDAPLWSRIRTQVRDLTTTA